MKISKSSEGLEVIDSSTVYLPNPESDFTLHFCDEPGFDMTLEIKFVNEESGDAVIKRYAEGNKIHYDCMNFSDAGTGTTDPIELAVLKGKKMYIMFWSCLQGRWEGKKKIRKVEYTIFLER